MLKTAICGWSARGSSRHITKTLLVMKLTFVLLTAAFLNVTASGLSQQVSFSGKNVPVDKVLASVEKQTGYVFFYDEAILSAARPISIHADKMPLRAFLELVLKDEPIEYVFKNKTVVLSFSKNKTDDELKKASLLSGLLTDNLVPPQNVTGVVKDSLGNPIEGASVAIASLNKIISTNSKGEFTFNNISPGIYSLEISYVGFASYKRIISVTENAPTVLGSIILIREVSSLQEVVVPFNTGYYTLPAERATGSFSYIDQKLVNRSPSSNIINRIETVTNGLLVTANANSTGARYNLVVRGQSTLSPNVNKDILIIVNGFPFEGDINSLNPNDVASVTLLKDAAAASIWGARSGNGVLVITTKNGGFNKRFAVEANVNMTVSPSPRLTYDKKYVDASTYLDIERYLFDQGYYDQRLTDNLNYPWVSPAVEYLDAYRNGAITQGVLNHRLDSLRGGDLRSAADDAFYRASIVQQYAVNMSGGTSNISYYLGLGYDRTRENLVRNGNDRFTITSINTFNPVKNLELTGQMIYAVTNVNNNNNLGWGAGASAINMNYPYASLKDAGGAPAAINFGNSNRYTDSLRALGFLDWKYRPLQELALADNDLKTISMTLRATAKYSFTPSLSLQINFQNEKQTTTGRNLQDAQSYQVRNMVNRYSAYNASNRTFTYPFPKGAILRDNNGELVSNNLRAQLGYNRTLDDHAINVLAGAEIRESKFSGYERWSYGYNPEYGTAVSTIDYVTVFPVNGGSPAPIPALPVGVSGTTQRFVSYYANAAYSFRRRYTVTLSGRKDGANMFGVRANDRVTPLWSAGIMYDLSQEDFYRVDWLPSLKFRATYGYNGNVYQGAAYLTAQFNNVNTITNLPYGVVTTAPNPELHWEKVRNINFGVDFAVKKDIIRGSLEYYIKNGLDLVQDLELAPSTGFPSFRGNSASTTTRGIDLELSSTNINRAFKWTTNFIINYNTDRVRDYAANLTSAYLVQSFYGNLYPGNYILGLYSYKSGGIDPANGDPIGYLDKAPTKDYAAIVNTTKVEDLVYHGSARPLIFGAVRNAFTYKRFNISANITYRLKYFFRKPTVGLNYQTLFGFGGGLQSDYLRRWTKPGDEQNSTVPSISYATNDARNLVYKFSEVNVERGDHIRLADISVGYDVPTGSRSAIRNLQVYGFINNIGLLWKANNAGLDPDFTMDNALPRPISFSLGVRANF